MATSPHDTLSSHYEGSNVKAKLRNADDHKQKLEQLTISFLNVKYCRPCIKWFGISSKKKLPYCVQ